MKVISFDLDGTLVTDEFSQIVWHRAVPELYADKYGHGFDEAQKIVFEEYGKVGDKSLEWYDIKYWLRYFRLSEDWRNLLKKYAHLIRTYPEVTGVLSELGRSFRLIITSNASREFLNMEIEEANLSPYFEHIFSATSDFEEVKKTESFYLKICSLLNIDHRHLIHVGDHYEFDYNVPRKIGIASVFLDRHSQGNASESVKDLREFMKKMNESM
jgi:putative hydrolase of the HAD superfamily